MANYDDPRLAEVESGKAETLNMVNETYDSMIGQSDKHYNALIDNTKAWEEKQSQLQQERTDFTIEQIEQQKDQAHKDYVKEQSGAYVDWQKESNRYSVNAEQAATGGLNNSGYGESSQVSMYNTYQNRIATARESYRRAVLNYDNAIKDAQLQNNSILAEIAFNSLQTQLELSLEGFQYKNELIIGKLNTNLQVDEMYHGRYMDVLGQINTENALAEQVRQFNASLEEEKRQYSTSLALDREQFEWQKAQAAAKASSSGGSSKSSGSTKVSKASGSSKASGAKVSSAYGAGQSKVPNVNTYEEAAAYMRKAGVATGDGGLMTENEWKRRKYAGSKSAETSYSSYKDYLNSFTQWRTENPQ